MRRIMNKLQLEIVEEQFGFKKDSGTRNAIFLLRIISERAIAMQNDIYLAFIDYEKAFDKVKHDILMNDLKDIGIDGKDLRLINNLYRDQIAAVLVEGQLSDWVSIERGVRQGCVLSPDLFSLYAEFIMRKMTHQSSLQINGTMISNIRYADDTILIANSDHDLQTMLTSLNEESRIRGLNINRKKTKIMVISKKKENPKIKICINNEELVQVEQFEYLGSMITSDCRCDKEIKRRIALAKKAFMEKKSLLVSNKLRMNCKLRFLKCYVQSVLLYGCESWTIWEVSKKKIEAAEMWFLRRMMRISWVKKMN